MFDTLDTLGYTKTVSKTAHIRMRDEDYEAIQRESEKKNRSMNFVIVQVLRKFADRIRKRESK